MTSFCYQKAFVDNNLSSQCSSLATEAVGGWQNSQGLKDSCENGDKDESNVVVPLVCVQLVQGFKLLPQQGTKVKVQTQGEYTTTGKTFIVEPDPCMAELGLSMET